MRPIPAQLAIVCVGLAASMAAPAVVSAQSSAADLGRPRPPLSVRIESPSAGVVAGPVIAFEAAVSDPAVTRAVLEVNGQSYHVPVEQGRVTQQLVAIPGNNRVGIVIERGSDVARDSLTFRYDGEAFELIVLLTWPSRGEIIDLWVREPSGETCKWDHRQTAAGGSLLDFSTDAIGFGSQAYVLRTASAGRYRVKVHYWGAYGDDDARGLWTHSDLVGQLDELDRRLRRLRAGTAERAAAEDERHRILDRLDAWATPAATQTPVHGEIVAFPGTPHERRFRFDVVVHRTGELAGLGEIELDAALIAAARRER